MFLAQANIGDESWKIYPNKNGGRRRFQIDLVIDFLNYAIENEWKNIKDDKERPKWMRKGRRIPCDCNKCLFCNTGNTNRIHHKAVIIQSSDGKIKYKRCTGERVRIVGKPLYCKQCYRE